MAFDSESNKRQQDDKIPGKDDVEANQKEVQI